MNLYSIIRDRGEALYAQIARHLAHEISTRYTPGDCLPSENELAVRFGVNRHTLRRAIGELVESGLLERRHGRGVFVLNNHIDYQIGSGTRFTENLAAMGMQAENKILRKQILPAIAPVAERLNVNEGDETFFIETLRICDGRPLCLISHFLPKRRFPNLMESYLGGSLHQMLAEIYGCQVRRTESLVTSVLPQGDDASLLGMPQNQPVLRIKNVNVDDADGMPIEYGITRFRADRIQLRINP